MDDLNVQINDQVAVNQQAPNALRDFITGPKVIFVILGIILLGEVIYAVRILTLPSGFSPIPLTAAQSNVGKISLVAAKTSYSVNETIPVSVVVDTGGRSVNGVDLIVHYDPKVVEASPAGIVKGQIFDDYPAISINANQGLISISGIDNMNNSFNSNNLTYGIGQFAIINLKAKTPGRVSLTVDFNGKGSTTDSNLVEITTAKDILEKVNNLELTIK